LQCEANQAFFLRSLLWPRHTKLPGCYPQEYLADAPQGD
jgi:hypothetical protein